MSGITIPEDATLHEALAATGFKAERVMWANGEFRGMRIVKGGVQVHEGVTASPEYGWHLVRSTAAMGAV